MNEQKINLTKFIANSSFCSRRKAEILIKNNLVKINNKIAKIGDKINPKDKISIKEKIITTEKKIYLKLHKPIGYTSTNKTFKNEKNIFSLITKENYQGDIKELKKLNDIVIQKLYIAGRLDKNSSGLIILSNDGDFIQKLTHPNFNHEKEYLISFNYPKTNKKYNEEEIKKKFKKGIIDQKELLRAKKINFITKNQIKIILDYGKKRQIRRMLKHVNLEIKTLKRLRIGKIKLNNLKIKKWNFIRECF